MQEVQLAQASGNVETWTWQSLYANPGDFSEAYSPSGICLEKVLFLEKAIETIGNNQLITRLSRMKPWSKYFGLKHVRMLQIVKF
jgi:hypothetical protein